jgi:hypothetical protein
VLKSLHLLPGAKHPVFGKNKAGDSIAGQKLRLQDVYHFIFPSD